MAGKPIHVIRAQAGLDIQPLVQGLNQASQRVKQFATKSKQAMETSGASTLDTLRMLGYSGGKNAKSIPGGPSERTVQLKKQQEEEEKLWRIQQARARDERRNADMAKLNADIADRQRNAARESMALDRQAAAVKAMLTTEEERHNARVKQYDNLLKNNRLTVQQHAAAVKMSVNALRAQSGGFSNVHGVMMQASFAVEDFTQVLLMGGGLNMALMSASNNITMLLHSSGMITSVWGTLGVSTIPLVLSGVNALVQSMNNSQDSLEDYTSKLTDYFSDLNKEIQRENSLFEFRRQLINIPREVQEIKTLEEAYKRLNKLKEEEIAIEQRRQTVERRESRTIEKMLTSRQELVELQEKFFATARERVLFQSSQAGMAGDPHTQKLITELTKEQAEQAEIVVRRRELLAEQLEQIKNIEEARLRIGEYLASISALQGMKEERNKMRALQQSEELEEFAERREKAEQDRVANLREQEEIEKRRLKQLEQEEAIQRQIDAQNLRARQREELFLIKATDEQRERFNLLKGMLKFSDIDSLGFSGQMTAQQFMASQAFLQAQIQATQSQLEKLSEEQQVDQITKGSLEQDAFRAQAEAFKQVFELRTPARNPQIDDTNRKLDTLVDLYRKLRTVVEIVGQ